MESQATERLKQYDPQPVGSTVYLAYEDLVVDHDANSRNFSGDGIQELAETILDQGQIQPIKVTGITHRVGAGYRRSGAIDYINTQKLYKAKDHPNLASAVVGGKLYIRCEIIPEMTSEELYLLNIAENENREDATPIDRARQMVRLTTSREEGGFGYTQAQCAVAMSKSKKTSQATVSRYVKTLNEAPAWAIKLVHDGKRPMENLIEAVGHPSGSKERDAALDSFKAGETAAVARAKTRKGKEDKEEGADGKDGKGGKRGVVARTRTEIMAAVEEWAYVKEGDTLTPFEEAWQQFQKFAAGKASAKKTMEFFAERFKAKLAKAA